MHSNLLWSTLVKIQLCASVFVLFGRECFAGWAKTEMCGIIEAYTERNCMEYMGNEIFGNYGCFCGRGNAGDDKKPVDETDACCKRHDRCYGDVELGSCSKDFAYLIGGDSAKSYTVAGCENSTSCVEDGCTAEVARDGKCICADSPLIHPCSSSICQCDLQFAKCLGRASYNKIFANYDQAQCEVNTGYGKYQEKLEELKNQTAEHQSDIEDKIHETSAHHIEYEIELHKLSRAKRQVIAQDESRVGRPPVVLKSSSKRHVQDEPHVHVERPLVLKSFSKLFMDGDVEATKKLTYIQKKKIMHLKHGWWRSERKQRKRQERMEVKRRAAIQQKRRDQFMKLLLSWKVKTPEDAASSTPALTHQSIKDAECQSWYSCWFG